MSIPKFEGQVALVTGATRGIGAAIALELAQRGLKVVGTGTTDEGAAKITSALSAYDGRGRALDVNDGAAVEALVDEIVKAYGAIHVLVNNAGVVNLRRELTVDGIETVLAVNHLAYFLLTHLLLPRLRASAPARVVNVASDAHRWGRIDLEDLGHERSYRAMRVYGDSKLANILFTYELARRLEGTGVTANCLHPGAVATRLGQNNGRIATVLSRLLHPFFRSPEQGAATAIYLASSPAVQGVSGGYFVDSREARSSRTSQDGDLARRLWDASARLAALSS